MALVTAADIACLSEAVADALPDVGSISRPTDTPDAFGGQMRTWTTIATNVPCRLAPETRRPVEEERGGVLVAVGDHVITFAAGTDIAERDRVVIGAWTFEVVGVRLRGALELTRRAVCMKVS